MRVINAQKQLVEAKTVIKIRFCLAGKRIRCICTETRLPSGRKKIKIDRDPKSEKP